MNNKLKTITIRQSFSEIIKNNDFYIDKTKLIYNIIMEQEAVFLKKPRRFGKSMLISTIYELFSGNKKLFDGLYIKEKTEYNFEEFPVIYISFAGFNNDEHNKNIEYYLDDNILISYKGKIYNRHDFNIKTNSLGELIKLIYNKFGKQVVLLVDEYDKIATENFHNLKLLEYINIVNGLYSGVKEASLRGYLKFTLISGLTKILSNHLLSTLNHLNDISNDYNYYDICGYTKQEIIDNFYQFEDDYLPLLAKKNGNSIDAELLKIKEFYNGYNFGEENDLIYNPYSINLLFQKQQYDYYWSNTGRSNLIIDYLQGINKEDYLSVLENIKNGFILQGNNTDILELKGKISPNAIPILLYITGYLTIKKGIYVLPNKEAEYSIIQDFIGIVYDGNEEMKDIMLNTGTYIYQGLRLNNPDALKYGMINIQKLMIDTAHQWQRNNPEGIYKSKLYDLLKTSLSPIYYDITCEDSTNGGDSDIIIVNKANSMVIIIEAKGSEPLDNALNQIKQQYLSYYKNKGFKKIILLGTRWNRDLKIVEFNPPEYINN